jgi:hypothetical protein
MSGSIINEMIDILSNLQKEGATAEEVGGGNV